MSLEVSIEVGEPAADEDEQEELSTTVVKIAAAPPPQPRRRAAAAAAAPPPHGAGLMRAVWLSAHTEVVARLAADDPAAAASDAAAAAVAAAFRAAVTEALADLRFAHMQRQLADLPKTLWGNGDFSSRRTNVARYRGGGGGARALAAAALRHPRDGVVVAETLFDDPDIGTFAEFWMAKEGLTVLPRRADAAEGDGSDSVDDCGYDAAAPWRAPPDDSGGGSGGSGGGGSGGDSGGSGSGSYDPSAPWRAQPDNGGGSGSGGGSGGSGDNSGGDPSVPRRTQPSPSPRSRNRVEEQRRGG
ncbi:hypothetical protein JKP88DRAFT_289461 [Tribonema minus]|uniref:Uncharacterized protein n=1 Tax=Tribonema minus TaxID=303371 RepID=A0A836CGZ4_9STRA|nr:hypothetical protein JKP88DRAFT_289461 [Tribonema minus]